MYSERICPKEYQDEFYRFTYPLMWRDENKPGIRSKIKKRKTLLDVPELAKGKKSSLNM